MIAEFDRLRGWEAGGHRSCAHWLAFRTQVDLGTAREKVRAARALETLPQTAAAMSRGELTFSQVRALTRIADAENESELLELARGLTIEKLERVVRAWRRSSGRRDEAERERERFESRALAIFPDEDGMYLVRGRLLPEVAALLMRAIDAASDQLFRERPDAVEDSLREAAQRRADAVSLVAERALAAGLAVRAASDDVAETCSGAGVPISGTRARRYQVVLHMDASALAADGRGSGRSEPVGSAAAGSEATGIAAAGSAAAGSEAAGSEPAGSVAAGSAAAGSAAVGSDPIHSRAVTRELSCETSGRRVPQPGTGGCELEDGTRLSHDTARRLCCDASVVRVVHDRSGGVLDVGRRTRTIPPALRRALEVRDGGCRFPGCGLRFTDAHHVRHWADAGETSLWNCLLLCSHHHRLVHEGGWRVEWWGGRIPVFIDPRGNTHSEARVRETPPLPAEPAGALAEARRRRGGAPVASVAPGKAVASGTAGTPVASAAPGKAVAPGTRVASAASAAPGTAAASAAPGLGARWRTERDIPHEVWRRASEAL
jgi:hypothetical protein